MLDNKKPIRLGMVGGGNDAFIGAVHRIAARIDGQYELVAGALSSTPEKAQASGQALGLDPSRIYDDFKQMAMREARLKAGIQAVAIVTPNHVHYPAAVEFLKRGIHVICDKPLTSTPQDARRFAKAVEKSDALLILTHNYTGYPLVRQARAMVRDGALGELRLVQVEYPQDWLTVAEESNANKQAEWRTDPQRSGAGGSTGDIGTHAFNLACFVSGLKPESLSADLHSFVPGRLVDDNAHVMLRFSGGARGMLWCSQVAPGNENSLKIRVYGSKGGLEWNQESPNRMLFTEYGMPTSVLTRAGAGSIAETDTLTRTPSGHPEGYLEAFANIYLQTADVIRAHIPGSRLSDDPPLPGISDGLLGVSFVDACVRSSKKKSSWVSFH